MSDKIVRTEPMLDEQGKPVTLFGLPVVVSADLPETPGITFGRPLTADEWADALRAAPPSGGQEETR